MKIEDINTKKITASEGHILTNGTEYARITFLAEGADPSAWYEIPEAEYERIMAEEEAKMRDSILLKEN